MTTQYPISMFIITLFLIIIQPINTITVDTNCLTFLNNICIICNSGYQLYFNWCWSLDTNCKTYATSGCAVCNSGFQLLQGWCYVPDPNCQTFSSDGVCILCNSGQTFYNGWCQYQQNCKTITYSVCTACQNGYYLDDGFCYEDQTQSQCSVLTPYGCILCNSGYQSAQGKCYNIDNNCLILSGDRCAACNNGFHLVFGWCQQLSQYCLTNSSSDCTACNTGNYLSGGWCWNLGSNCLTRNLTNDCTKCAPGYYLKNGDCTTPDPNCKILTPTGCNACIFGYYLSNFTCYSLCNKHDITGACTNCSLGYTLTGDLCIFSNSVTYCSYFNSKGFCFSCLSGYTIYNGQCYSTQSYCQVYDQQTGSCNKCQQGYFLANNSCTICGSLTQSSDANCLSPGGGINAASINGIFVACNLGCLVCIVSGINQVYCTIPQQGYYLVAGEPFKCSVQTCLTCVPGTKTCKSCFYGYTLVAGSCIPCIDPYAAYCRPTNTNSSVFCYFRYALRASSNSYYCQSCAANCLRCDSSGPGNCDPSQCFLGYVQLLGTQNCTACINSCPFCDPNDLTKCRSCGSNRYNNSNGSCLACSNGCQTCTSATNCSFCQLGYSLVNVTCYTTLAFPCAIMSSASQCSVCFYGYTLSGINCTLSPTSSNTYKWCPYGYYFSNSSCLRCSINCQVCVSVDTCYLCIKGYYITNGICILCSNGCSDCSSSSTCNQASTRYYLQNRTNGSNSGIVSICNSPCLTCQYYSNLCLTCIDGYVIAGSTCVSNFVFSVKLVLGPSNQNTSIFLPKDYNDTQLYKALNNVARLMNSFCQILQSSLMVSDPTCTNAFRLASLTIGSIVMTNQVNTKMLIQTPTTQDSLYQQINSKGMDGVSIVSASITSLSKNPNSQTFPSTTTQSTSSSTSNLPLILGISIGIATLIIIIVVIILVIKRRKMNEQEQNKSNLSPSLKDLNILALKEGIGMNEFHLAPSPCITPYNQEAKPDGLEQSESQDDPDDALRDAFKGIRKVVNSNMKKSKPVGSQRVKRNHQEEKI